MDYYSLSHDFCSMVTSSTAKPPSFPLPITACMISVMAKLSCFPYKGFVIFLLCFAQPTMYWTCASVQASDTGLPWLASNCHNVFFLEMSDTFALHIERVPMFGPDAENQKCTQKVSSDFMNIGLNNFATFPCFPLAFTRAKYPANDNETT